MLYPASFHNSLYHGSSTRPLPGQHLYLAAGSFVTTVKPHPFLPSMTIRVEFRSPVYFVKTLVAELCQLLSSNCPAHSAAVLFVFHDQDVWLRETLGGDALVSFHSLISVHGIVQSRKEIQSFLMRSQENTYTIFLYLWVFKFLYFSFSKVHRDKFNLNHEGQYRESEKWHSGFLWRKLLWENNITNFHIGIQLSLIGVSHSRTVLNHKYIEEKGWFSLFI